MFKEVSGVWDKMKGMVYFGDDKTSKKATIGKLRYPVGKLKETVQSSHSGTLYSRQELERFVENNYDEYMVRRATHPAMDQSLSPDDDAMRIDLDYAKGVLEGFKKADLEINEETNIPV